MHILLCVVLFFSTISHAADVDSFLAFTSDWSCKPTTWSNANRTTFCAWPGITCSGTNAMTKLVWNSKSCSGTVDLSRLPATVIEINIDSNNFGGPLVLITSAVLQYAYFSSNQFVSVDLTNPPVTLVNLYLYNNRIAFACNPFSMLRPPLARLIIGAGGNKMTCDLNTATLPSTLTRLEVNGLSLKCCIDFSTLSPSFPALLNVNLQNNFFTGIVNLATLPPTLTHLNIWDNKFTVQIQDLTTLPPNMDYINIGVNGCTGTLNLSVVHSKLTNFHAERCGISCCFDFAKINSPSAFSVVNLDLGGNQLNGTLDFTQIPPSLRTLVIRNNRFSGNLSLSSLQNLTSLQAATNSFTFIDLNGTTALNLADIDVGDNSLKAKCPLDLSNLPPKLTTLDLRYNNINCSVDFTAIRAALTQLYLSGNYLWGLANFSFPSSLSSVDISEQLGASKPVSTRCPCNTGFTSVDLSNIPATMKVLYAAQNGISCCLLFEKLPQNGLTHLHLYGNAFSSTLNLTAYPTSLRELLLHDNKFTGLVNLTHPSFSVCNPAITGLNTLRLSNNAFTAIDMSNPSACLQTVEAQVNRMTNPLFMTNTKNIQTLWLGNNKFSGNIMLHGLSPNLINLNLANNEFTNRANWTDLPPKMTDLILSGNLLWRSMNNATLPLTMKNFDISKNQFCGNVTVSWCPRPLPPGIVASSCPRTACPSACNNVNADGSVYRYGCWFNNTLMGMAGVVVTKMCVGNTAPIGTCPNFFCPGICPQTISEPLALEKMSFSMSTSLTDSRPTPSVDPSIKNAIQSRTRSTDSRTPSIDPSIKNAIQSKTRVYSATRFTEERDDKLPTKTLSGGTTIQFSLPDEPSFEATPSQTPTLSTTRSWRTPSADEPTSSRTTYVTPSQEALAPEFWRSEKRELGVDKRIVLVLGAMALVLFVASSALFFCYLSTQSRDFRVRAEINSLLASASAGRMQMVVRPTDVTVHSLRAVSLLSQLCISKVFVKEWWSLRLMARCYYMWRGYQAGIKKWVGGFR